MSNPPHMSIEEFRNLSNTSLKKKASPKYHNKETVVDGIRFQSILEANYYLDLKLLLKAGEIKSFNRQPEFVFDCGTKYRADFIVWGLDGIPWVVDTKGMKTDVFKIKEKLWKVEYPNMELRVIN